MKHAKRAVFALAALVLALALAGCGEMTAEKLARKVARAARRTQITQVEMTAGLAAGFSGQSEPGETGVRTEASMQLSAEPRAAQVRVNVKVDGPGLYAADGMQSWLRQEQGLAAYTCLESTGQWVRTETPLAENAGLRALADIDPERLTLLDEKKAIDKTDTWQLSASLTGQELADILGGVAELQAALGLLDWQNAPAIQTTFYIHPRSKLPVRIELQLETGSMPDGLVGQLLRGAGAGEMQQGGRLHVYYDQIGYEAAEVEAVPMTGLNSAVSPEQLASGEIRYVIEENGQQLQLDAGPDWYAYGHHSDSITLARQDGSLTICYTMYTPDADSTFFIPLIETQEVEPLKSSGMYLSHGAGPALGGFETQYISCEDMTIYFAWGPVGDACLYLRAVQAGSTPDVEGVLSPLLDMAGQ